MKSLALIVTASLVPGPIAFAASPGANVDPAQRLAAVEARIAAMGTQGDQHWLTEQRAAEIKALVQDVLADADTRASLLQAGANAGYDSGFVISSTDGNWLLRFNLLMQQRFVWSHTRDTFLDEFKVLNEFLSGLSDRNRYGFENTRSRLILSGHVVNPNWFYRLDVNFGTNQGGPAGDTTFFADEFGGIALSDLQILYADFFGLDPSLLTHQFFGPNREGVGHAYLGHDCGNGWLVRLGTMKLPFQREELVEAQYQLAVERSIFNYMFTTGYSDGLAVSYTGDQFRFTGMFSDGERQGHTIWSTGPLGHAEYALTGRAELKFGGNWDQFNDFTSPPQSETAVLIGGAVHWQRSEGGVSGLNRPQVFRATFDASAEFDGWNLFGALTWNDIDSDIAGASNWRPWGFVAQGGFYLMHDIELFARYEWTDYNFDDIGADSDADNLSVLTGGINYYMAGHNAKWTTDVGYGFNPVVLPAGITGWRTDLNDRGRQWVLRSQVQIYF